MPDVRDHITPEDQQLIDQLVDGARDALDSACDPRLLVLAGLEASGETGALSDTERLDLERGREGLASARAHYPVLDQAVKRTQSDVALFNQVWDAELTRDRSRIRRQPRRLTRWPARIGLGLSAAVLLLVTYLSFEDAIFETTVSAPALSHRVIELQDGSSVRLAPGASLTYVPGSRFSRAVELTGDAFFDVSPEATRFSVETPTAVTTVLGTRFGIASDSDLTEVILVSGKVAVSSTSATGYVVVLEPGQMTAVRSGGLPDEAFATDVSEALPWSDLLLFRETTMTRVVELLMEHRGILVELGPGLANEMVTGTFGPDRTPADILSILAAALGADVENRDGVFLVTLK